MMLLPFTILTAKNKLYRDRFYACFRLKGMLPAQAPAVSAQTTQPSPQ
jgi:hypothetical protein